MYRFNEELDAKGKKQHIHQIFKDGEWKDLIGTSSIGGIIHKPLVWWGVGLACATLGWVHPNPRVNGKYVPTPRGERIKSALNMQMKIREMLAEDYLNLLDEAYNAHSIKLDSTADEGTDTHLICENWIKSVMAGKEVLPTDEKVLKFVKWAKDNIKRFIGSEAYCYSEKNWLGGITDCVAELNNGEYVIIDFKHSRDIYFNNLIQVALYAIEIEENGGLDKNGKQLFVLDKPITNFIIIPFGSHNIEKLLQDQVSKPYNVEEMETTAIHALELMRAKNKFENN